LTRPFITPATEHQGVANDVRWIMEMTRREWMLGAGATLMSTGCSGGPPGCSVLAGEVGTVTLFPGKAAMRLVNDRPPCLETPWRYFQNDLTPNEAFYVRWHLQALSPARRTRPGTRSMNRPGAATE